MEIINCGKLIDGIADESYQDMRIRIEEGVIQDVGQTNEIKESDADTVIDHSNETVLPGLIDCHVHIRGLKGLSNFEKITTGDVLATARATADLRSTLKFGFTSLRDAGSRISLGIRDAVDEGSIVGPRIYSSERIISQTAGHGDNHFLPSEFSDQVAHPAGVTADGVDECIKQVRSHIRKNVDLIKICTSGGIATQHDHPTETQYTNEEVQAIVDEAHRSGIPVASHAHGTGGVKRALTNGVDTVEHGVGIDSESIDLFHETGAIYVPTLTAINKVANYTGDDIPEWMIPKAKEVTQNHFDTVKRAYDAGVPVAHGTDLGASPEGFKIGTIYEFELFVNEVGMTNMDAIKSGTSIAAKAVSDNSIGAIEPGRKADLLVLGADPLEDITNLKRVERVYKGGKPVN